MQCHERAGGLAFIARRSLTLEVGDDSPARAGLAVAGDRVGVAQSNYELSFFQGSPVAKRDRPQVRAVDLENGQVEPGVCCFDGRTVRFARVPDKKVGLTNIAQDVVVGKDQAASVDDNAGAELSA